MSQKMKITGVAPQIGIPTLFYLFITFILSSLKNPSFQITTHNSLLILIGIIWAVPGIIMVVVSGRMLVESFNQNKLMRKGLHWVFRNPMYGVYFLFIIPGICLLFNSWLVLTTIPVNYILFEIFVQKEYVYLWQKFGKEYEEYLKKVLIKFL